VGPSRSLARERSYCGGQATSEPSASAACHAQRGSCDQEDVAPKRRSRPGFRRRSARPDEDRQASSQFGPRAGPRASPRRQKVSYLVADAFENLALRFRQSPNNILHTDEVHLVNRSDGFSQLCVLIAQLRRPFAGGACLSEKARSALSAGDGQSTLLYVQRQWSF
jgi:hypothetical protein